MGITTDPPRITASTTKVVRVLENVDERSTPIVTPTMTPTGTSRAATKTAITVAAASESGRFFLTKRRHAAHCLSVNSSSSGNARHGFENGILTQTQHTWERGTIALVAAHSAVPSREPPQVRQHDLIGLIVLPSVDGQPARNLLLGQLLQEAPRKCHERLNLAP